jgi:uncharacterized membrane protein YgcG
MNNIYDILELCLQELENGADLETVLARYPDLVSELRPILKASIMARAQSVAGPSPDAVRRGRAKLLQHAAQMREAKVAPRKRMIPFFQRLAISFTLAALFLSSGTGLVSASSSALPGENLYPVKLTWENVRLFFTFNEEYRETLEHAFENERLHEVNELLVEGRHETIQFAGVYMEVNGITYVSGIHVAILDTSILPTTPLVNGAAVTVTGHTNSAGFVDVETIELLPAGTVVPPGQPVELKADSDDGNKNENGDDTNPGEDNTNDDNGNSNDDNTNDDNGNSNDDNTNDDNGNSNDDNANDDNGNSNDDNTNDDNGNSNDDNSNSDDGKDNNNDSKGGDDGNKEDNSGSGGGGGDDDGGGGGSDDGGDD